MDMLWHAIIFLAVLTVIVVFSVIVENLYWRRRDHDKMARPIEVIGNFFLGASYKLVDALAIVVYVFFLYDLVRPYGLELELPTGVLGAVIVFLLVDLAFWLTHFAMHKVRWFWTGHVTHHSSDRYNFTVALRQNFTVVLNGAVLIWWIPLALIGADKELVLLCMEVNLLYQFFLHTEMPSPLDRFGAVLNTPSHHRVHHACNREQIDRNFGGTLILWDKLFGTFTPEMAAGDLTYGITRDQPRGYNPIVLLFHEWRDMFRDVWRERDFRIFTKSPDWAALRNRKEKKGN